MGAVDLALSQSDTSKDLEDSLRLTQMDVAVAEHKYTTKLVPLTNIGFTQGVGSQRLGMELRREIPTGTALSYGVVANRIDDNGDYEVTNPMNARAYVKLSQGFFRRWGKKYNTTDLSVAELTVREEDIKAERARQSLILQTVGSYYDLVLAGQLLDKAGKAVERSQENLDSAKARQAVGLVSKADVYRAELALLNSKSSLTAKKRELERANNSLSELLRLDEKNLQVAQEITLLTPAIPADWEEGILDSRLDWQAQQISMEINRLEMDRAHQDLLPDIGLSFTVEQKGEGDNFDEAVDLDQTNWSVQLEMLSDLDSFQEENALERTRLARAKLRRSEYALKRRIYREVNEAFLDLVAEEQNQRISQQKLRQALMALDLAKTRYEKGLSDNLDLIDAESAYSDAELDIARAKKAYNLASVSLAFKLGVLDRKWLEDALHRDERIASVPPSPSARFNVSQ